MNPIHPTVVWLTWRQIFANRRLYLALLFSLAPLVVAVIFRSFTPDVAGDSRGFYLILQKEIVVGVLLPLAALIFGTTAFGGEIEDGTLLYLLVKPVARWRIVFSKYIVSATASFVLMLPGIVLPWLAIDRHDIPAGIPASVVWGVAVAAVLYAAIFTMIGLVAKHSLVIGLMYVVIFEELVARTVAGVRPFSVREYAAATMAHMADPSLNLDAPMLTTTTMWNVGLVMFIGALAWTIYKLAKYQVAERL
jgi:ABC-2 type transport system permease protein